MSRLDQILQLMLTEEADGVQIRVGLPPAVVFGRTSRHIETGSFREDQIRDFVKEITTAEDLAELHSEGSVQLHYEYESRVFVCSLRIVDGAVAADFTPADDLPLDPLDRTPVAAAMPDGAAPEVSVFEFEVPEDEDAGALTVPLLGVEDEPRVEVAPPSSGRRRSAGPSMDLPVRRGSSPGGLSPRITINYTRAEATNPPEYGRSLNRDAFEKLLRWMVEQDATDLHITPRFPPTLRVDNLFQPSQGRSFAPEEIEKLIHSILSDQHKAELQENSAVDLSYDAEGLGRFRINVFRQLYGTSAAVRYVRSAIESLEHLNLPSELSWLTGQEHGLILFTGPTGSGKSTTMAAIIQQMNVTRQLHVLTLEHPIEFLFRNERSLIQQREVGVHTPSFLQGLRDALRENPDVIMVGELRDLETVAMAISAAETGHLILATMHANTSVNAVSRLIDVFPDQQKAGARAMIADVLQAVVNLRLLRHSSGRGLVPAVEFLKTTNAIASQIRDNKLHQMRQVITTSGAEGMWPFERHLVELFRRGEIDYEAGYSCAPDKRVFEQYLQTFQANRSAGRGKRGRS